MNRPETRFRPGDLVEVKAPDEILQTLDAQGIVPRIMTAAQYREFVAAETEKFGKIVAQANIKVEN